MQSVRRSASSSITDTQQGIVSDFVDQSFVVIFMTSVVSSIPFFLCAQAPVEFVTTMTGVETSAKVLVDKLVKLSPRK